MRAALELYADGAFEQTTVADIAARAGVTERTFFRHFADKREVLFDGAQDLLRGVLTAIAAAPASASPVDVVVAAFAEAAPLLEQHGEFAAQRAAVISSNPGLQERELLKLAALGAAAAQALRDRGVAEPAASLAADTGVTVFRVGFEAWIGGTSAGLAECIRTTWSDLRALTSQAGA
jgi:AcrR family transcriptional regulator